MKNARVIRIHDTLNLEQIEVSESYMAEVKQRSDLQILSQPAEMKFDKGGNLMKW